MNNSMPATTKALLDNFDILSKYFPLIIDNNGNIINRTAICPHSTPILNDNICDKDKFVAQLYTKNKKVVKVTSELYDGELVKEGRHNIECADSGDFCFWPFETEDKVIKLDYEGGRELSRVNYITRKLTSWNYGELSSQEGLDSRLKASCTGLEKKI